MKKILLGLVVLLGVASSAMAIHVNGHVRKDGTHIPPHYRSTPNGNPFDNWSAKGNVNPYTGRKGTKDPYRIYLPQRKETHRSK